MRLGACIVSGLVGVLGMAKNLPFNTTTSAPFGSFFTGDDGGSGSGSSSSGAWDSFAQQQQQQQQQLAVTLPKGQGTVHGKINPATPCVREFLDIPYAQPPLGDLRFAFPEPALPFGDLDATEFGPSCMQYLSEYPPSIYTRYVLEYNIAGLNMSTPFMSEDCLSLSVWAPTVAPTEACPLPLGGSSSSGGGGSSSDNEHFAARALPVIIFFYGGAFTTGGQDVPYQIPSQWINRTHAHLVVTFNYRLNIFGFPNAAGLAEDRQNPGLMDQRMVVEWVRDNIAAFGGDPGRITLWGQSAGATAVGFYQFAWRDDPIASAVVMDSGSEMLMLPFNGREMHGNFTFVADHFGCGRDAQGLSAEAEFECMRGANVSAAAVQDVIEAHDKEWMRVWGVGMDYVWFMPAIDDVLVFADYEDKARKKEIADIVSRSSPKKGVLWREY